MVGLPETWVTEERAQERLGTLRKGTKRVRLLLKEHQERLTEIVGAPKYTKEMAVARGSYSKRGGNPETWYQGSAPGKEA